MYGTRWYSFKHNAWAQVTDEPVTTRGYYTVEFPALGTFRRYNAARIRSEVANQANIDAQLDAQLFVSDVEVNNNRGQIGRASVPVPVPARNLDESHMLSSILTVSSVVKKNIPKPRKAGVLIGLVFDNVKYV